MARYGFLSPEWIEAAQKLQEQHRDSEPPSVEITMNLVIESVPFGEGALDAHLATTDGLLDIDLGHLEQADVKISLDYSTAKAVLVDQDAEAAMSAFMTGRVRVEGDMTRLLNYQSAPPTAAQQALIEELRAITE